MDSTVDDPLQVRRREKDYFYAVLDLPLFATDAEINERHRALSLVFHPDKQRDERLKQIATETFLEVQAAYEVLSDTFLREVYDTLGYDGLRIKFPKHFKKLPTGELRPALREVFYEGHVDRLQSQVNSRATLTCFMDARELLHNGWLARGWYADLSERLSASRLSILSLRHSVSSQLAQQTRLQVISRIGYPGLEDVSYGDAGEKSNQYVLLRGNILGVISHQYSRTNQLQIRASLPNLRGFTLSWSHEDKLNVVRVSAPLRPVLSIPPITLTFRRRLFRDSLTLGSLEYVLGRGIVSAVNVGLVRPSIIQKGSLFGSGWATGVSLRTTLGPTAYVQWQAALPKISTFLKLGFEFSALTGLVSTLEGVWSNEAEEMDVAAAVMLDVRGVVLRITFSYLGQTFVLPISVTDEHAPLFALVTALIPVSAFALADYFILRKLRSERRARRKAEHEDAQEEYLPKGRVGAESVAMLLKDTALRNLEAEKRNNGLVILEALYLPLEDNRTPMPDLGVNVTVPVQALVHDGQLSIPGGRSKSVLRGFYDPLPECVKRLSVRYEFRGRKHYAEVGEHAPLVLPLEGHLEERTTKKWTKSTLI